MNNIDNSSSFICSVYEDCFMSKMDEYFNKYIKDNRIVFLGIIPISIECFTFWLYNRSNITEASIYSGGCKLNINISNNCINISGYNYHKQSFNCKRGVLYLDNINIKNSMSFISNIYKNIDKFVISAVSNSCFILQQCKQELIDNITKNNIQYSNVYIDNPLYYSKGNIIQKFNYIVKFIFNNNIECQKCLNTSNLYYKSTKFFVSFNYIDRTHNYLDNNLIVELKYKCIIIPIYTFYSLLKSHILLLSMKCI